MWIKLTGEYVNLAHVIRVRFNKTFRNGKDEWSVELEGIVKGELQFFTRYRGADAEIMLAVLSRNRAGLESAPEVHVTSQALVGTVHDVAIS